MNPVVFKTFPSVNAAYQENQEQFSVSITSVYNKLNGIEVGTSAALVRETACEMAEITEELGAVHESWLPGYRIKILEGNGIEATEHRLEVLRSTNAGPLPGKSLVIYDPSLEMAVDVFPCEDGQAQERSLLGAVLPTIEASNVLVMDRNFCVGHFLCRIIKHKAFFICRQHKGFAWEELSPPKYIGQVETGKMYEQWIKIVDVEGKIRKIRRIKMTLNKVTRYDDKEIFILTN